MQKFIPSPSVSVDSSNVYDLFLSTGDHWKKIGAQMGKLSPQDIGDRIGLPNILQNGRNFTYSSLFFSLYTHTVKPIVDISGFSYSITVLNSSVDNFNEKINVNYEHNGQQKQTLRYIENATQVGNDVNLTLTKKMPDAGGSIVLPNGNTGLLPENWQNIQIISDKSTIDNMSEISNISGINYSRVSLINSSWTIDSIDTNSVSVNVNWNQIGWSGNLSYVGICDSSSSGNILYYLTLNPNKNITQNDTVTGTFNGLFFKF